MMNSGDLSDVVARVELGGDSEARVRDLAAEHASLTAELRDLRADAEIEAEKLWLSGSESSVGLSTIRRREERVQRQLDVVESRMWALKSASQAHLAPQAHVVATKPVAQPCSRTMASGESNEFKHILAQHSALEGEIRQVRSLAELEAEKLWADAEHSAEEQDALRRLHATELCKQQQQEEVENSLRLAWHQQISAPKLSTAHFVSSSA